jgi:hypothetical protein
MHKFYGLDSLKTPTSVKFSCLQMKGSERRSIIQLNDIVDRSSTHGVSQR